MPRAGPEAGRGTPAEVVVRMLSLKHMRNWSFAILEWELRTNLLYREFTRVGGGKVPDAKTMETLARALGPEVIDHIHRRVVAIAQQEQVITGRKMRVDTTVVEANIHYPTDFPPHSGLLTVAVCADGRL